MSTHKAYVPSRGWCAHHNSKCNYPISTGRPGPRGRACNTCTLLHVGVLSGKMFPLVHPPTPGIAAIGRIAALGPDGTFLMKDQLVFCNPSIRARDDTSGGDLDFAGLVRRYNSRVDEADGRPMAPGFLV
jgi:hypothetical protein